MGKVKTLNLDQINDVLDQINDVLDTAEQNLITLTAIRERAEQMVKRYDSPDWHKNPYAFGGMLAYKAILDILNGEADA